MIKICLLQQKSPVDESVQEMSAVNSYGKKSSTRLQNPSAYRNGKNYLYCSLSKPQTYPRSSYHTE